MEDNTFSQNSVMSMSKDEVMRSISCIEQQLLIEDSSYSMHNASSYVDYADIQSDVFSF